MFTKLVRLNLASNFDGAGTAVTNALSQALQPGKFQSLASLDLSDNPIRPEGAAALSAALMVSKPPLTDLSLADCHIGATGVKSLKDALVALPSACEAMTLDLFSNQVGKEGAASLGEMCSGGVAFKWLCCRDCVFGSEGSEAFAAGVAQSGKLGVLGSLDLSSCGIGIGDKAGCASFATTFSSVGFPSLKALNLADNSLHDGSPLALIESLGKLTTLTWLDLSCNRLREDSGKALAETLPKLTSLVTLGLNDNVRLGDAMTAAVLRAVAGTNALVNVHVCTTGAAAEAKEAAVALLGQRTMKTLDMRDNVTIVAELEEELKAAGAKVGRADSGADVKSLEARMMW